MTFDFLPPQAYTKDTLLKAYNWLQSQSDQVKELATTPDQLVSLFLKSTRLGQDSLQRYANNNSAPSIQTSPPVSHGHADQSDRPSVQSFKTELKSLAGMMGDLEKAPVINPNAPIPAYQGPTQNPHYQAPLQGYQGPVASSQGAPQMAAATTNVYVSSNMQNMNSAPVHGANSGLGYDENTQNLIREVKNELNLSSEMEALRMLVKIGYQKVRSLYK